MTWGQVRYALASSFPDAELSLLDVWIRLAYEQILESADWSILRSNEFINASGAYRAGTVTVINGSNQVTGSGTDWPMELSGWKIMFFPDNVVYWVTIVDNNSLELDRPFFGDTASGIPYVMFQDTYALPDHVKHVRDVFLEPMGMPLKKASSGIQARSGALRMTGIPQMWWHGQDVVNELGHPIHTIVLFPAPENNVVIRAVCTTAAPGFDGTNTSDLVPSWIPAGAIIALAKAHGFSRAGNTTAAALEKQTADTLLAGMIRHETHRHGPYVLSPDPAISRWRRSRVYR